MDNLDAIPDRIRQRLEDKNTARDLALQTSRRLIRHCAHAIRAVHRGERTQARAEIDDARKLFDSLRTELASFPDLYHAGYAQDALKEFAEACIVYALVGGEPLPDPDDYGLEYAAYLCGLGEAAGELRRKTLDVLRHDNIQEAERLLAAMDDIYDVLVTIDYPDAITGNLRRITDMVRGVVERTRGDLTTTYQQMSLKSSLARLEGKLPPA